jgi:nucleotide-binding universal stress UspA family protein
MADDVTARDAAGVNTDERLVVCAIDGSAADGNAAEVATQLAVLAEARLALIAVAPVAGAPDLGLRTWTMDEARRALELTAEALDRRVAVDVYLDSGNPVRRIVELAERKRALILVVGTSTPVPGRPPSITASGVSRSAPCPVVIVPETAPVPALDAARPGG